MQTIKKYIYIIVICILTISTTAQERNHLIQYNEILTEYDSVIKYHPDYINNFTLSVSKNPINFKVSKHTIHNPFYNGNLEYNYNYKNFPVSYSVIYNNRLVSLFNNGEFVCHNADSFLRDRLYEQKLNSNKFSYHWVIDDKLYAYCKSILYGTLYEWTGEKWIKANITIPANNKPVLFSDKDFIVIMDCHGEWGGTIYFYDRKTQDVYITESTCANTVIKKDNKYLILSDLGHMSGSAEIKSISDPRLMRKITKKQIGKYKNNKALNYNYDKSAFEVKIDLYDVLLFSMFEYGQRQLYITNFSSMSEGKNSMFLTEIIGKDIQIVHPLFEERIYTHEPVTKVYGEYTLINRDFYGIALDREVSVIIIKNDSITLLNWNENHNR